MPSHAAELLPNRTPIDNNTGRPAMIFSAEVMEPTGNEAEAIGWYAGAAVTRNHTCTLRKINGEREIQGVK